MNPPFKVDYHTCGTVGASFEWVKPDVIFVRGGRGWVWGDRYSFTCLIETFGKEAEVKGFMGTYNRDVRATLFEFLKETGIKVATWERTSHHKKRTIKVKLVRG